MPIVCGTYYNPWTKSMKCDNELLRVVVNPEWTMEEVCEETCTILNERFFELEKRGFTIFIMSCIYL